MLDIANVSHRFDATPVLDDVSLRVAAGELVCLLGPSGCGKTTLLRLVAGLETLRSGRITIGDGVVADGSQRRQVPPERRGVGLMFQDYALFPHLTVARNIAFGLPKGVDTAERVRQALADARIEHLGDQYPHTLSGGQQQRVALLRALAPKPAVLLLDEPFSGLDAHLRARLRQDTLTMLAASGAATLMVTHDAEEAMLLADRIVVLDQGRVAQDATPEDINARPANPFVARLLGQATEFEGVVRDGAVRTPLGPIPAPGLGDGVPALCLVRADGIDLLHGAITGDGYLPARVESARTLGLTSHLLVKPLAEPTDGAEPPLVAVRLPHPHCPAIGSDVAIRPRPRHTLVFPQRIGSLD